MPESGTTSTSHKPAIVLLCQLCTFCILTLQTRVVQMNFFIPPLVYPDVPVFWSTNFSSLPFQWCEAQYRNRKLSAKDINELHALFTGSIWPITHNVKRQGRCNQFSRSAHG